MLRSAPHHICWASTHRSETCGGIILSMRRHRPLLTGRPWRNRTLASQPRPQVMRHGYTDLCSGWTKILSTRHNIKYVDTVSGCWTAALFRSAGEPNWSFWDPGVFTIIIIFFPCWWLSCNKLFYLSERRVLSFFFFNLRVFVSIIKQLLLLSLD